MFVTLVKTGSTSWKVYGGPSNSLEYEGTSTDDAFGSAIDLGNSLDTGYAPATIVVADGEHVITPGVLPAINCNFIGAGASLKAATTANDPILTFDDEAAGREIKLLSIVGPNFGTTWQTATNQKGVGIRILRAEHSVINIKKMEGLLCAMDFAGHVNNHHIGEVSVTIQSVLHNNYGINLNAGSAQCESNRFEIGYMNNNGTSVLMRNHGSGGNSLCCNNHFDILVVETSTGNIVFDLDGDVAGQTSANTFIVRENIALATNARSIVGGTTLGCNYFRFPNFDFSKMNITSPQIFDGLAEMSEPGTTNFKARSMTWGAAAPTGGVYWQKGSIRWNNNPGSGDPVGWRCISSGTPGTWQSIT